MLLLTHLQPGDMLLYSDDNNVIDHNHGLTSNL